MIPIRRVTQELLRRLGWEVRRSSYPDSEQILLRRLLDAVQPEVVFDVGANVGQYASLLRRCGYAGAIVSFEALPAEHAGLTKRAASDPAWRVAPRCALGRASTELQMHVAGNSLSSSLLPMLNAHRDAAPESRYVSTETVRVARLDELTMSMDLHPSRILLKIDTQGYEAEVLAGAEGLLDAVCALQLELSVTPLYDGAPSMRQMLELCERLGFELFGLHPGFYDMRSGRLLQADGFFLRAGTG